MNLTKMPKLKIGKLEAEVPIVQGGMSVGISLSGLASAVANEGGIGVIGAAGIGMLEPDFETNFKEANKRALRKEIRRAKKLTNGIIGVNIMIALSDYDELSKVALEEGADVIFLGAGLPLDDPNAIQLDKLRDVAIKVIPIVSSSKVANLIFKYWARNYNHIPDAVVVEGPKAGGHLGFKLDEIDNPNYQLEKILPEIISVIKPYEEKFGKEIPVIAAGGIYTGADIYKFMKLGAQGVQMATRFVATYECDADDSFKEAYLKCKKDDLIIIKSPVGLPGRAIKNEFLEEVSKGKKMPFRCPWKCLRTCDFRKSPYCIAKALTNAKMGNLLKGFAFAGANAYRVDRIVSVKELIGTLVNEYEVAASKDI